MGRLSQGGICFLSLFSLLSHFLILSLSFPFPILSLSFPFLVLIIIPDRRIAAIKQRLLRHPQFSPPATEADRGMVDYHKITPLDALDGSTAGSKYVLGKLSEITEGRYFLEVGGRLGVWEVDTA